MFHPCVGRQHVGDESLKHPGRRLDLKVEAILSDVREQFQGVSAIVAGRTFVDDRGVRVQSVVGADPCFQSELAAWVLIRTVRYLDGIVHAVEAERLSELAGGKGRSVARYAVIRPGVVRGTVLAAPPGDDSRGRLNAGGLRSRRQCDGAIESDVGAVRSGFLPDLKHQLVTGGNRNLLQHRRAA